MKNKLLRFSISVTALIAVALAFQLLTREESPPATTAQEVNEACTACASYDLKMKDVKDQLSSIGEEQRAIRALLEPPGMDAEYPEIYAFYATLEKSGDLSSIYLEALQRRADLISDQLSHSIHHALRNYGQRRYEDRQQPTRRFGYNR